MENKDYIEKRKANGVLKMEDIEEIYSMRLAQYICDGWRIDSQEEIAKTRRGCYNCEIPLAKGDKKVILMLKSEMLGRDSTISIGEKIGYNYLKRGQLTPYMYFERRK